MVGTPADPDYARWLERNATASLFIYSGLIAVLLPLFHFVLRDLPGVPPGSDSLVLRCVSAGFSLLLVAAVLTFRGLRRYAVTLQTLNAMMAVLVIAILVVNSGNHYAYVASALVVIVAAQQAFFRTIDLVVVFAFAFLAQAVYSAAHGIFGTPMNLATLGIFGAGYLVAFAPAAMRIRMQQSEIRSRLEAQRVKAQLQTVQDALVHLAQFDALTNLPNRTTLWQGLAGAIDAAARDGSRVAVIFLDLDRFKDINDTLGHHVGDRLLQKISRRFLAVLPADGMLARWGGDEFVAVVPAVRESEFVAQFAQALISSVADPVDVGDLELLVAVSAGIAVYPDDGNGPDVLIRNADTAMYEAKRDLPGRYQFFTSAMHAATEQRHHLPNRLRKAIDDERFVLHYQPVVDARTNALVGAEALVRWVDEDGRLCLPGEFIVAAEESGVIVPLGAWVLRAACEQLVTWQSHGIALDVAVNVSPRQLAQGGFTDLIESVLRETGADPARLQIEITEAAIMTDVGVALEVLQAIRSSGIRIAIDDFGTGYSSFAYLERFDVDVLKMDRMFVRDIEGERGQAIARSIIAVAHTLGLSVTAEGVETAAQCRALSFLGSDHLQGFHLGRPVPISDFDPTQARGTNALVS
ncbi:MAG: EAL domain-containing protein [Vulcanimicrobiaceae bacterium]